MLGILKLIIPLAFIGIGHLLLIHDIHPSRQAARVSAQSAVGALGRKPYGPERDRVVREGAAGDAAAAVAGVDGDGEAEGADVHDAVRDGEAVAAHGEGRAVEEGRFAGVVVGEGPVPVGLRAGVVAFGAQGELVEMEEVAVEMEEDALGNESVRL